MYFKLGHLDKPITVIIETNEKGKPNKFLLVDGYTRFLFARNYLHRELIPAKYISYEEYDIKQSNKENRNGFQSHRLRTNEI